MRKDKKSLGGRMRFILPTKLGEVALFDEVLEVMCVRCWREVREPLRRRTRPDRTASGDRCRAAPDVGITRSLRLRVGDSQGFR